MIARINKLLYGVFAITAVGFGLRSLFGNGDAVPFEQHHLERELGAAAVFIGLMALWCMFHYERRREVHAALIVFAGLLSMIHWQDFLAGHRPVQSIIYNSAPLLVLLLMALLSWAAASLKTPRSD